MLAGMGLKICVGASSQISTTLGVLGRLFSCLSFMMMINIKQSNAMRGPYNVKKCAKK